MEFIESIILILNLYNEDERAVYLNIMIDEKNIS